MLMGMAASQARYLALTARKSNVEYEGQQINQARTALANQTANLFNQMMGMSVPTPPSVADYTTVQYSYSDGSNTEAISNYYQLGNSDSDYNYVVTTYHNEKVYQGSRKKMSDPQVQATYTNRYSYNPSNADNNISRTVTKAELNADGSYFIQESNGTTKTYRPVTAKEEDQVKAINHGLGQNEKNPTVNLASDDLRKNFNIVTNPTSDQLKELGELFGYRSSNFNKSAATQTVNNTNINTYTACTEADADQIRTIFGSDATPTSVNKETKNWNKTDAAGYTACADTDLAAIQQLYGADVTDATAYMKKVDGTYMTKEAYDGLDTTAKSDVEVRSLVQNYYKSGDYYISAADYNTVKGGGTATAQTVTHKTMDIDAGNQSSFIDIDTNDADMVARAMAAIGCTQEELGNYMLFNTTDVNFQGFVKRSDVENMNKDSQFYTVDNFSNQYYWNGTGYVTASDMDNKVEGATLYVPENKKTGIGIVQGGEQTFYTDGNSFVTKADLDAALASYNRYLATGKKEANTINEILVSNDPTFSNYTQVGNCQLSEIFAADLERDQAMNTEIMQIIKDMKGENGDRVAAENLEACFDINANGDYVYKGGIYKFQMGGTTYYTTKKDLDTSLGTSIVDNNIDVQQEKLRYYNGVYVDTKVEDTKKALLETDGNGRFKSIKLEDDNVQYTLNVESKTDEDAYNDAMNRYYYEKEVYEKNVSDINAKTEIIQAQDRTLELRLEQLNTEQSALQNEMEAVKKVVDKHVELGFKTFGG